MFHTNDDRVRKLLMKGHFGLERESLRISKDGFLVHTPHPFGDNPNIVRDFCENQTEINTPVLNSSYEAMNALIQINAKLQKVLYDLEPGEMLWSFSNPPYIREEKDVPIAKFTGVEKGKMAYRKYLSDRYGRYKMTFCGIHVNFSFDERLLHTDFSLSGYDDFTHYKNTVYLTLARRMVSCGWLLVAITAASPLFDSSFTEKGVFDGTLFNGLGSLRCSELGYWNHFTLVFDYSSARSYVKSIKKYIDSGWIKALSELYYPIRLKPAGENTLENLTAHGANHIELRMFDLNPLENAGLNVKDVEFAHLMMVWLMSAPESEIFENDQILSVQNFKNAAHFDLETQNIIAPGKESTSVSDSAKKIIGKMKSFYGSTSGEINDILEFEEKKFTDKTNRYAWKIRERYGDGFVKKGIVLARKQQLEVVNDV